MPTDAEQDVRHEFRGNEIEKVNGSWQFADNGDPVASTWKTRPCGYCGKCNTVEGHDGCLGTLPDVINACCGHGRASEAYIQFSGGSTVRGQLALNLIQKRTKGRR